MVRLDPPVEQAVRQRLEPAEADAFLSRLDVLAFDIIEPLEQVYGTSGPGLVTQCVLDALDAAASRPAALRRLDRRREIDPAWFQRSRMIGYVCYADRFAGSLPGIRRHLDYLTELGVTYLHLMPLLRPRDGENDGGYAVADYGAVDPRIGTMTDLQALAGDLHDRGIALCGIESALAAGDAGELTLAIRRLESMYAVVFSFGGIPLIYMGDELAMLNDPRWREDPAHADDNRWMHRPPMDSGPRHPAARPRLPGRPRVHRDPAPDRRAPGLLALRSGGTTEILPTGNRHVLTYRRAHPRSAPFLSLTNFGDVPQAVDAGIIARGQLHEPRHAHSTAGELSIRGGRIELPAWGFLWLTGA